MSTLTATPNCIFDRTAHEMDIVARLHQQMFAAVEEAELACLIAAGTEEVYADGAVLAAENEVLSEFHVLLQGHVNVVRHGSNGAEIFRKIVSAPSFMGDLAMFRVSPFPSAVTAVGEVRSLCLTEDSFWAIMAKCPGLRVAILNEFNFRIRGMAAMQSQQDRLITLGTMTAGLMHELNNPGAAARRAASLLRDNLNRMHLLARSFSEHGHTLEQRACLTELQERVLHSAGDVCMDSLQQSDREEEMGEWLSGHQVSNAWTLAPTLVATGVTPADLQCLSGVFPNGGLQAPLEWLEATASSMQQVALVEESVSRVHDLAKAVKTYVHEGQGNQQSVAVNESLHATLVLLKHKFREKQIHLEKQFAANLPPLTCVCSGLNQVWTNLLDNAIDAVREQGHIRIRTWQEGETLMVSIGDDGPGISEEAQLHIFEPFYTTKPVGVGTGMGLGIAQRIVENYGGAIQVHSQPGDTEFIIRVPLRRDLSVPAA